VKPNPKFIILVNRLLISMIAVTSSANWSLAMHVIEFKLFACL